MLLSWLFGAATPENPRFSLNDHQAVDMFLGGDGTRAAAGVDVSAEKALTYSPWWRGVNLLAGDVGKVPLYVYRRRGEGKERATDHPAFRLLRRKPNDAMTAFQFKRLLTGHAITTGNGYAYIFRDGAARPQELVPLDPQMTYPVREDARLLYVTQVNGEQRKLLPENVLHVKGFGYDGLCGYPVWQKAKEDLGLGLGTRKYAAVFFKNNARPGIALVVPGTLKKETQDTLRRTWETMQSGLDNAHRVALLQGGMDVKTFSSTARESRLTELMDANVRDVANWLGLPSHKLGDKTGQAYNSLEQENNSYLGESLDPHFVTWEEECWDKLLTEEEKDGDTHFVEFLRESLIRMSMTDLGEFLNTALAGAPFMTRNEARGKLNLGPLPEGDTILEPLSMGQGGAVNAPPVPKPNPAAAAGPVLAEAAARMVRRLAVHAERAAKKPQQFLAWLDAVAAEHRAVIAEALAAPCKLAAELGRKPDRNALYEADGLLAAVRGHLLETAGQATPDALPAVVAGAMAGLEQTYPAAWAARFLTGLE